MKPFIFFRDNSPQHHDANGKLYNQDSTVSWLLTWNETLWSSTLIVCFITCIYLCNWQTSTYHLFCAWCWFCSTRLLEATIRWRLWKISFSICLSSAIWFTSSLRLIRNTNCLKVQHMHNFAKTWEQTWTYRTKQLLKWKITSLANIYGLSLNHNWTQYT